MSDLDPGRVAPDQVRYDRRSVTLDLDYSVIEAVGIALAFLIVVLGWVFAR